MNAQSRIFTPVIAGLGAALIVGVATLGGTVAGDAPAAKADRFQIMGKTLCADQVWPKISQECLAWGEGLGADQRVRFITTATHDPAGGVTTLSRGEPMITN